MVDIQVRNLTKFFVIGENLLDNLSFEIQEGERVAILGRNGCGKTTLFNILTGQMDYDSGEVYVNPNKRLGLISQIPKFPAGYTVEDVLRTAYAGLMKLKARMERLEADMARGATAEQLREYDSLSNRFQSGGGYERMWTWTRSATVWASRRSSALRNSTAFPAAKRPERISPAFCWKRRTSCFWTSRPTIWI